jgi:hypothetical protein
MRGCIDPGDLKSLGCFQIEATEIEPSQHAFPGSKHVGSRLHKLSPLVIDVGNAYQRLVVCPGPTGDKSFGAVIVGDLRNLKLNFLPGPVAVNFIQVGLAPPLMINFVPSGLNDDP